MYILIANLNMSKLTFAPLITYIYRDIAKSGSGGGVDETITDAS